MNKRLISFCSLLALSLPHCTKSDTPAPTTPAVAPEPAAAAPAAPKAPPAPAVIVGMAEPFAKLSNTGAKPFNSGYAALKAKKYDEAAALFAEVTTTLPDYLPARFQAARAYLQAANPVGTRQQLEELLSRNFIAYAAKSASKEFAVFRTSPEWPAYQQAEARIRAAYAQGLGQDLVFVARSGSFDPPSWTPGARKGLADANLETKQEVYHFDPDHGRYRPLTATDGRVLAALRSGDGKRLVFVTASHIQSEGEKKYFVEPQFGFLDLTTLETAGPIKLGGGYEELTIGFGASGTPLVATPGALAAAGEGLPAGTYELDTARTGLTKAASDPEIKGERVLVRYERLTHSDRPLPTEVTLAEDRHSVKLGAGGLITSARTLSESSLAWSPGQRFFVYAGQLDACAAARDDKSKAAQNELFAYEVEKKAAVRIDAGPSAFDSQWLGDYLLAYETGAGAKSGLALYDMAAHKKTVLPLHHGAGFYGVPTVECGAAAPAPAPAAPAAAPAAPAPAPAAAPAAPVAPAAPAP